MQVKLGVYKRFCRRVAVGDSDDTDYILEVVVVFHLDLKQQQLGVDRRQHVDGFLSKVPSSLSPSGHIGIRILNCFYPFTFLKCFELVMCYLRRSDKRLPFFVSNVLFLTIYH